MQDGHPASVEVARLAQSSVVGFLMFGLGHERRRLARRRKVRRASLAATAVVVAVLSSGGLAGGASGGPAVSAAQAKPVATHGNEVISLIPEDARTYLAPPTHAFPLPVAPEYGDGLGAGRGHEGQDMFAPAGTPELAVSDAVVIDAGYEGGSGNYASIYDPAADRTYNYFHMLEPAMVSAGEHVIAGQQLGKLGCTGSCWGDHLHFEERIGRDTWGPVMDPRPLLDQLASLKAD
jgi:murein DD-endopeptidase MepM/ murein hydrolase activator NlpD